MKRSEIVYVVLSCLALPVLAATLVFTFWMTGMYDQQPAPVVKPVPVVKAPAAPKVEPGAPAKPKPEPAKEIDPEPLELTASQLWMRSPRLQGRRVQVTGVAEGFFEHLDDGTLYYCFFMTAGFRIGLCTVPADAAGPMNRYREWPKKLEVTIIGRVAKTTPSRQFQLFGERVTVADQPW